MAKLGLRMVLESAETRSYFAAWQLAVDQIRVDVIRLQLKASRELRMAKLKKDRALFADFDKSLKDFKAVPTIGGETSFVTLYRKPKEQSLLAAVPKAQLNQPFFFATARSMNPAAK